MRDGHSEKATSELRPEGRKGVRSEQDRTEGCSRGNRTGREITVPRAKGGNEFGGIFEE